MRQLKIGKQITSRETESLDKYLTEIGKVDLISGDEEVKLAKRIREGDAMALERLTKANLRFVVSVAKQYQNRGLPLNDLINEGNLGLMKAGIRFDETRGFKFISYAVWWIRQSIIQALAEQARVIRLPLNRVGSLGRIAKASAELSQRLEREPTPDELAECLHETPEYIAENMRVSQRTVSTHAPMPFDESTSLIDTLADDNALAPDEQMLVLGLKEDIRRVLQTLPVREMQVVVLYFGLNNQEPLTLEEIGTKFSLTRERVRQIKEKATRELRRSFRSKGLRSYLG
jgi:RNA polymerase primary sigma factor